jgi:hypothetical protein
MRLFSSTVMTPSLPTFSMASARMSPISVSPLALMVATWAICALSLVGVDEAFTASRTFATARSMPRLSSIGLWPASTRRRPSR